jgi:hypothetical protein
MPKQKTSVRAETEDAVKAAGLEPQDFGVARVLIELAGQVDYLLANDGLSPAGKFDNVTVPTYLKYAEALGMTPAARARIAAEPKREGVGGTLGKLRAIHGGKSA